MKMYNKNRVEKLRKLMKDELNRSGKPYLLNVAVVEPYFEAIKAINKKEL
jgi:hypothetical protein